MKDRPDNPYGPYQTVSQTEAHASGGQADFDQFEATELYCPQCRCPVPVRKFLLLVLPEGDKYEYRCRYCGTPVGDKIDRNADFYDVLRR
ncbi:MAG: hypothetical protein ACLFUE_01365 [Desulfobacteraceae bacterium]